MSPILKLGKNEQDEERELEFELDYLATLTLQQCFVMMLRRSDELKEMLDQYGHRRAPEIAKRT